MSDHAKDIRWIQRLQNFEKAFKRMAALVEEAKTGDLTDVEQEALIQRFEYTQELSWLVIRDFYRDQGETTIQGSRDAYRLAFQRGLITEGQLFMDMVKSRNQAAHTYNEETATQVTEDIVTRYHHPLCKLLETLQAEKIKRES